MTKVAVITGDIVESTFIRGTGKNDKFPIVIKECLVAVKNSEKKAIKKPFEIYRGDSFQGIVTDVKRALIVVLKIKAGLVMRSVNVNSRLDARIAIGIGDINSAAKSIKESDGIAFNLSGKTLDEMKAKNKRISILSTNEKTNHHLDLLSTLVDLIAKRWSPQQAEVVYHSLNGKTQNEIARLIAIKQPSIFQRAFLAHKNELMKALEYYEWLSESF